MLECADLTDSNKQESVHENPANRWDQLVEITYRLCLYNYESYV
jgi:hypothetical protein